MSSCRTAALGLIISALVACGGQTPTGDKPNKVVVDPVEAACKRNVELLRDLAAKAIACRDDDECPAGSYCQLDDGVCTLDCLPNEQDSAGGCESPATCNCYGQCGLGRGGRDAGHEGGGRIAFSSTVLTLPAAAMRDRASLNVASHIHFPAPLEHDGVPVTFRTSPGLLVACGDSDAFGRECRQQVSGKDPSFDLRVRADSEVPHAGPWSLYYMSRALFPRAGSISVAPVAEPGPRDGDYAGVAVPCGSDATKAYSMPISATVAGDGVSLRSARLGRWPSLPLACTLGATAVGTARWQMPWDEINAHQDATWGARIDAVVVDGAHHLTGHVTFGLAPAATQCWRVALTRAGSVASPTGPELTPVLSDAEAHGLAPAAPAWHAADDTFDSWIKAQRYTVQTNSIYLEMAHVYDGDKALRPPHAPATTYFRPQAGLYSSHGPGKTFRDLAIMIGAQDFENVVYEAGAQFKYKGLGRNYAEAISDAYPRIGTAYAYIPCLTRTFAADGMLQNLDCSHVLAPKAVPDNSDLEGCVSTGARIHLCPDGMCQAEPTHHRVWLCPVGRLLPARATEVAETNLCYDATRPHTEREGVTSSLFSAQRDGESDLLCRAGNPQQGVPLLNLPPGNRPDVLSACLAELEHDGTVNPYANIWKYPAKRPAACFSPLHFYAALQGLIWAPASDSLAARLAQHMLRQWLTLHTFVADAAVRRAELEDLVTAEAGNASLAARLNLATPVDTVDRVLRHGLDLMLGEALAKRLANLTPLDLRLPDYRGGSFGVAFEPHDGSTGDIQAVGLPAHMLTAASAYLRFTAHRLGRGVAQADGARQEDASYIAGEALRLSDAVRAVAAGLYQRAESSGDVPWRADYLAADALLDAAVARVEMARDRGSDDWSTVQLDDDEVPLYSHDAEGANANFFASSDHITDMYANSAVERARHTLEQEARSNWVNFLASSDAEDGRTQAIQSSYVRPLRDACGLDAHMTDDEVLAAFAAGTLTANNCFVAPDCAAAPSLKPSCLGGHLGEAVLAVQRARLELETARVRVSEYFEAFEGRTAWCAQLQEDLAGDARLREEHDAAVGRHRAAKHDLDRVAMVADTVARAGLDDALTFGAAAIARVVAAGASLAAADRSFNIESWDRMLASALAARSDQRDVAACLAEAKGRLIGLRSESAHFKQRLAEVDAAMVSLRNRQSEIRRFAAEAVAVAAREGARGQPSVAYRNWLGQAAERYREELRVAKHHTYLALRAFEYESQQTSPWHGAVLHARGPTILADVLRRINSERMTRTVNARRPEAQFVTVSLRDDVLELSDQSNSPEQRRHGTPAERFRHHLASDAAALFDTAGHYLGQGIQFSLPEVTPDECAERLTHVSAMVAGDFGQDAAPSTRMKIYKVGLFGSKWCAGRGGEAPPALQWRTFPRTSLTAVADGSTRTLPQNLSGYSVAVVDAHGDVVRNRFASEGFREGSSRELAGQGLYGSYAVVLQPDSKLALEAIEDIVLRLDYVSVANVTAAPAGR